MISQSLNNSEVLFQRKLKKYVVHNNVLVDNSFWIMFHITVWIRHQIQHHVCSYCCWTQPWACWSHWTSLKSCRFPPPPCLASPPPLRSAAPREVPEPLQICREIKHSIYQVSSTYPHPALFLRSHKTYWARVSMGTQKMGWGGAAESGGSSGWGAYLMDSVTSTGPSCRVCLLHRLLWDIDSSCSCKIIRKPKKVKRMARNYTHEKHIFQLHN